MLLMIVGGLDHRHMIATCLLGGWTNPFEKYARQIGSFPQAGVKIKNNGNHHLDVLDHVGPTSPINVWYIYLHWVDFVYG